MTRFSSFLTPPGGLRGVSGGSPGGWGDPPSPGPAPREGARARGGARGGARGVARRHTPGRHPAPGDRSEPPYLANRNLLKSRRKRAKTRKMAKNRENRKNRHFSRKLRKTHPPQKTRKMCIFVHPVRSRNLPLFYPSIGLLSRILAPQRGGKYSIFSKNRIFFKIPPCPTRTGQKPIENASDTTVPAVLAPRRGVKNGHFSKSVKKGIVIFLGYLSRLGELLNP